MDPGALSSGPKSKGDTDSTDLTDFTDRSSAARTPCSANVLGPLTQESGLVRGRSVALRRAIRSIGKIRRIRIPSR